MSEKVRVHEIAKELGIASKDVVKKAPEGKKKLPAIKESIQKCPSKTIIIIKGEKAS